MRAPKRGNKGYIRCVTARGAFDALALDGDRVCMLLLRRAIGCPRSIHFPTTKRNINYYRKLTRARYWNMESLAPGQLGRADGPLVWIDCEMTGLNPRSDQLLEIAVCLTSELSIRLH